MDGFIKFKIFIYTLTLQKIKKAESDFSNSALLLVHPRILLSNSIYQQMKEISALTTDNGILRNIPQDVDY